MDFGFKLVNLPHVKVYNENTILVGYIYFTLSFVLIYQNYYFVNVYLKHKYRSPVPRYRHPHKMTVLYSSSLHVEVSDWIFLKRNTRIRWKDKIDKDLKWIYLVLERFSLCN